MRGIPPKVAGGPKTERPETVVECYHHDSLFRKRSTVVQFVRAGAGQERPAVDPDHHGQLFVLPVSGSPDVQRKAVFTHTAVVARLGASRPEFIECTRLRPAGDRLRRLPTQLSFGGSRIGNTFVDTGIISCNRSAVKYQGAAMPFFGSLSRIVTAARQEQAEQEDRNHGDPFISYHIDA